MAKKSTKRKGGVSKSQAIRSYMNQHPQAGPTQVSTDLTKKGIKVSPALVSAVKAYAAKKNGKGARKGKATATNGHLFSVSALVEAKKLADELGGIEKAKRALEALAKLQ